MGRRAFRFIRLLASVLVAALVPLSRAPIVAAVTEAEQSFLSLYFTPEELQVVSATRSIQSIARVAENITVVTAADIELMNAHTMEEVVNSVPGVTTNQAVQFASLGNAKIQGPDIRHSTVLLNGVPLNSLSENSALLGTIPVQDIEKVEIIKGPASSVWGSAMGGVINIITKAPGAESFQGAASLDYGTENTGDYRAAASGKVGRLGYRLSGTNLRTDGLIEGCDVDAWHVGTRLDYALSDRTSMNFMLFYGDTDRGDGVDKEYDLAWRNRFKDLLSQLAVASRLGQRGSLDISLWTRNLDQDFFMNQLSSGQELFKATYEERRTGAGAKYTVGFDSQELVVGADYSAGTVDANTFDDGDVDQNQWAVFANDTITFGRMALVPGLRYDDISTTDEFWSPSLGATYLLAKDTLLRATVARGFTAPNLGSTSGGSTINRYVANPDLTVEKIWSYQLGLETGVLDSFWLKVSAFRHDVEDALQDLWLSEDSWTRVNTGQQRRQGLDIEMKTRPMYNFTLAASACFLEVEDTDTGEDIMDVPKEMYDISLKYDDLKSLRGLLKGRYIRQDEPDFYNADFSGFLVDLNVMKKLFVGSGRSLEVFVSVHNLLDESQYHNPIYPNPDRWVEGGVRASF